MADSNLLELKDVSLRFGGLSAISDVNLNVRKGEIFAVIGPNGAGKTSLFNVITGVYKPSNGKILFCGREISENWSLETAFGISAVALFSALCVLAAINLESIWEQAISGLYVYQEPFAWRESLRIAVRTFLDKPLTMTLLPGLLGAIVGGIGAYAVWSRGRRTPDLVSFSGISRTFQNIRLFRNLSVLQNVLVGMHGQLKGSALTAICRSKTENREERTAREKAQELLDFVGLAAFEDSSSGSLPYGHQRRLEIARALASCPTLLLLDEPAAGLNPSESQDLMELIRAIKERGVTVMLIEHHMKVVMGVSDRIAVLDYGEKIAEGTPEEIKGNRRVVEAYLGVSL